MPKESKAQRRSVGRVMHEYAHGELKSGPGGKGGKVKSRKQAIAIALSEAGESKYDSKSERRRNLSRTKAKEARGKTAQQEKEGRSHVGAAGKRESSPAMRRKKASGARRKTTTRKKTGTRKKAARR